MFKRDVENSETRNPIRWRYWMVLLTKYRLYECIAFHWRIKITCNLENNALGSPLELGQLARFEVMDLGRTVGYEENLFSFWQAARFWSEGSAGFSLDL